jgi:valyl-tRNA synthetase
MNIREGEMIVPLMETKTLSLADRWILSRLSSVAAEVNALLEEYRFNDAAGVLYQFVWHEFCDWYLEMVKPVLYGDDEGARRSSISTLVHVLETALRLLHPFMPFISEEIWQQIPIKKEVDSICIRRYPVAGDGIEDEESEINMGVIMDAVLGIRTIRGELNISPSIEIKVLIKTQNGAEDILKSNLVYINKLARAGEIEIGNNIDLPKNSATSIKPLMEICVPLKGLINVELEIDRLKREIKKYNEELIFISKKLSNKGFISKAPKAVVEENKSKYNEIKDKIDTITANIEKLAKSNEEDAEEHRA